MSPGSGEKDSTRSFGHPETAGGSSRSISSWSWWSEDGDANEERQRRVVRELENTEPPIKKTHTNKNTIGMLFFPISQIVLYVALSIFHPPCLPTWSTRGNPWSWRSTSSSHQADWKHGGAWWDETGTLSLGSLVLGLVGDWVSSRWF